MTFSNDELLLALVSLVRATRPAMLRQDADGFSIDFEAIAASKSPRDSDRLLMKLGAAMQGPPPAEVTDTGTTAGTSAGTESAASAAPSPPQSLSGGRSERTPAEGSAPPETETEAAAADGAVSLEIGAAEAREIADALSRLEQLQAWPKDVLRMSRALRARLASASAGGQ